MGHIQAAKTSRLAQDEDDWIHITSTLLAAENHIWVYFFCLNILIESHISVCFRHQQVAAI